MGGGGVYYNFHLFSSRASSSQTASAYVQVQNGIDHPGWLADGYYETFLPAGSQALESSTNGIDACLTRRESRGEQRVRASRQRWKLIEHTGRKRMLGHTLSEHCVPERGGFGFRALRVLEGVPVEGAEVVLCFGHHQGRHVAAVVATRRRRFHLGKLVDREPIVEQDPHLEKLCRVLHCQVVARLEFRFLLDC